MTDLEDYAGYILRLDASFEDLAWNIRNKSIRIYIDPNQFKTVDIPVTIAGEVSGAVYLGDKPRDRIVVCFYRSGDSTAVGQATTESDGSFDFSGLRPGFYIARISPAQLNKLHMTALPATIPFLILPKKSGDLADGLKFVLHPVADILHNTSLPTIPTP